MDHPTLNTIGLCSGVGMLEEGVHAGLEFLGIRSRTVLYAEREAFPASDLAARMEEGILAPAPIWFGDFTKLPAKRFRGMVDGVIAGFPCQDLSIAGRRAGLNGKRSGLFFNVLDVADDCGAWFLVLENVAGIATATASVVDEAEGELEERAAARVMGELADRGWNAEWITLSASDVGASHGRARWFCFAWRVGALGHTGFNAGYAQHGQQSEIPASRFGQSGANGESVDDSERTKRREECFGGTGGIEGYDSRRTEENCGTGVADQTLGDAQGQYASRPANECWRPSATGRSGKQLANTTRDGWNQRGAEPERQSRRSDASQYDGAMAYADGIGRWPEGYEIEQPSRLDQICTSLAYTSGTRPQGLMRRGGG